MILSMVAGGRRLEYVWIGPAQEDAPTLVFLHEGLGSLAGWRDFPAVLAAATGLGALVYSRAGYGGSDAADLPRPVRFMHDEAVVLGEVLDAAGVRDAVLVGHSDGASSAVIHAGSAAGARIHALVLSTSPASRCTTAILSTGSGWRRRLPRASRLSAPTPRSTITRFSGSGDGARTQK
jgi:pimeloyl-ACP methyl ester carboxylesterase